MLTDVEIAPQSQMQPQFSMGTVISEAAWPRSRMDEKKNGEYVFVHTKRHLPLQENVDFGPPSNIPKHSPPVQFMDGVLRRTPAVVVHNDIGIGGERAVEHIERLCV